MSVKLIGYLGYGGYPSGSIVEFPASTEASLIASGQAIAATGPATPGPVTTNAKQGSVTFAAGTSSLVITNAKFAPQSLVHAYISQATADATALRVERVVADARSVTIYLNAAATAPVSVKWALLNYEGPVARTAVADAVAALFAVDTAKSAEGDSITAATAGVSAPLAFLDMINTGARYRMNAGFNQAVAGQTAFDMANPTQINAVLATNPKVVEYLAGTNDLEFTSDSAATILGNIQIALSGYLAGGVQFVTVGQILPRSGANALTAPREIVRVQLNALIDGLASSSIRVIPVPAGFDPLVDTIDGLHPNWAGAAKLSAARAVVMNSLIVQTDIRPMYLNASNLLLAAGNPQLTGTSGAVSGGVTGSVATGYTLAAALDGSMTVVGSKNPSFNGSEAQVITVAGTPATAGRNISFSRSVTISGEIGDKFEAWIEFALAAGSTGLRAIGLICTSGAVNGDSPGRSNTVVRNTDAQAGVIRTQVTGVLAATTTSISVNLTATFDTGALNAVITAAKPFARKVV